MQITTMAFQPSTQNFEAQSSLQHIAGEGDWVGLRFYQEKTQQKSIRNEIVEESNFSLQRGAMVEVLINQHLAYAGTSDLSPSGLKKAAQQARRLAQSGGGQRLFDFTPSLRPQAVGRYQSPYKIGLDQASLEELISKNIQATKKLKVNDAIINAEANLTLTETSIRYVSSSGTDIEQNFLMSMTSFVATAKNGNETQKRSISGALSCCRQVGIEVYDWDDIFARCQRAGFEAIELTKSENCPSGEMDLLLNPDQMLIQIHESIGHPLEIDRILGDERNYAGWSFVQPGDFGQLQYGSKLMNITFDPTVPGELASYAFDDSGNPAKREFLIKEGRLIRGLGSLESQKRSGIPGVANFRSASWNRAPIDRMANINLEPGDKTLEQLVSMVERGIYMQNNTSWSIDDYRRKFQFGCEYAQLIENGKLGKVVKNPNYRGISVPFWNKLKAIGNKNEAEIYGSPYCGKGEPSQVIRVGHSSPPALFEKVEVFGGGK